MYEFNFLIQKSILIFISLNKIYPSIMEGFLKILNDTMHTFIIEKDQSCSME